MLSSPAIYWLALRCGNQYAGLALGACAAALHQYRTTGCGHQANTC